MPQKSPDEAVKSFVGEDPQSRYTLDGERGAPESELCREGDKLSRKCIQIQMHSTKLFQTMQDMGFFCALPMDPARTYIECKRIPK